MAGIAGAIALGAVGLALAALAGAHSQQTARQFAYPEPTCDTNQQVLDTRITQHPSKHSSDHSPKFAFEAFYCNSPKSELVQGSKYVCNLDGKGFKSCDTPRKYSGLHDGKHKFKVRVKKSKYYSARYADHSPAKFAWKIH